MQIRKLVRSRVAHGIAQGSSYKDHTNRKILPKPVDTNKAEFISLLAEKLVEEAMELKVELDKIARKLTENPAALQDIYSVSSLDEFGDVVTVIDEIADTLGMPSVLVEALVEHKAKKKGKFTYEENSVRRFYVYQAESETYLEKYRSELKEKS